MESGGRIHLVLSVLGGDRPGSPRQLISQPLDLIAQGVICLVQQHFPMPGSRYLTPLLPHRLFENVNILEQPKRVVVEHLKAT